MSYRTDDVTPKEENEFLAKMLATTRKRLSEVEAEIDEWKKMSAKFQVLNVAKYLFTAVLVTLGLMASSAFFGAAYGSCSKPYTPPMCNEVFKIVTSGNGLDCPQGQLVVVPPYGAERQGMACVCPDRDAEKLEP